MTSRMKAILSRLSEPVSGHWTVRHLPLLLFLLGILAYGASFAWYMLHRLDLFSVIATYGDDAFYYFQIAKSFADGQFSTFDGGITRTNGYHPLWMLLITPLWWVFDPDGALFAVKVFEIMLVAGAVALIVVAARLARLHWVVLFAALPMLYRTGVFTLGLEAAAGLFMLGLLFLVLVLYARDPVRWRWLLATVAFLLPWVRLEYVAISLAATAALCFIEWSWRAGALGRVPGGVRSISIPSLAAFTPLLGACAGVLVYFAWNGIVFGGIVPVSGATKQLFSQAWLEREGGYSFIRNFQEVAGSGFFDWELLVALEVCVYFLLVWWFGRRSRTGEDWLFLAFLAGVFALSAGHVAKFVQSVLTMHPHYVEYSPWYYVPAYLMMALVVPVRCYVAIYVIECIIDKKWPRIASILSKCILASTALFLFAATNFSHPLQVVDAARKHKRSGWVESSYEGTLLMNRILPEGSIIGSWDSGVIGYFSRFPVVNLDGLVNSYDYMRMSHDRGIWETLWAKQENSYFKNHSEFFRQLFGITHFANDIYFATGFENVYFEIAPFLLRSGSADHLYAFALWSEKSPRTPQNKIEPASWFWEQVKPHFDFELGGVGAVVGGGLVHIFARECEDGREESRLVLLLDREGRISGVSNPWENRWTIARGRRPGSCTDTIVLPGDAVRPIRMEVLSEGDGVSRWIGDARRVVRSGGFDVYYDGNRLIYTGEECSDENLRHPFFLHVFPEDEGDLPIWQRRHGFENLYFAFDDIGRRMGNTCIAVRVLPEYDIARIRTGQYVPDGPQLWHGELRLDVDAERIAGVFERAEPMIRSDNFDVYYDGNRLLYTGGECSDENLRHPFFLHVLPEDDGDLPAAHREHGFHILSFRFEERRLPLDFHFRDRQPPGDVKCIALVELPGYEVARIRTGQYVPDGPQLWHGELEIGRNAP